jgi:hypothetical protein
MLRFPPFFTPAFARFLDPRHRNETFVRRDETIFPIEANVLKPAAGTNPLNEAPNQQKRANKTGDDQCSIWTRSI